MAVNLGTTNPELTNDLNAIITDRRDIDFSSSIALLEPNAAPIVAITSQIAKRVTTEAEFRWFESYPLNRWLVVNANGPDNEETEITLPDVSGIYKGDILRLSMQGTGTLIEELVRVTAVDGANNKVTVTRNYDGGGAHDFSGASPSNPLEVLVIGNIAQEGSRAPEDRNKQPVVVRNVTGIQKTPFAVTGSLDASRQRANPQERARLQKFWGIEHKKQIENMLIFGELIEDLSEGAPRRMTRGIVSFIQSNVFDFQGDMRYEDFVGAAEQIFQFGDNDERWVFAGGGFITALAKIGADQLRLQPAEEEYGVKFNRVVTPHGDFRIVRHRMLRGPIWGRAAIVLDLGSVEGEPLVQYRPLSGRDTKLQLNIQHNDEDAIRDQYITEFGLQLKLEQHHALFFNAA